MTNIRLLSLTICAGIAGCVSLPPYKLPASIPFAEFSMGVETDSTHTMTVSSQALAHADSGCGRSKYGLELASDLILRPANSAPVHIAADAPFAFSLAYGETSAGREKECLITSSFTPVAGHRYHAVIFARNQVAQCGLGIFDLTGGEKHRVDFQMPASNCAGQPNGRPTWTLYEVHVLP